MYYWKLNLSLVCKKLALSLIFIVFTIDKSCAGEYLTIGYFDVPVHTVYKDKLGPKSALLSYSKLITDQMNVQVTFKKYPLSRLFYMLEQGRIDMILIMLKTPEREKKFVYSTIPILTIQSALALGNTTPLDTFTSYRALADLRIDIWKGAIYPQELVDAGVAITKLSGTNVIERGFKRLLAKRSDGFYSPDKLSLEYMQAQAEFNQQIKVILIPDPPKQLYTAFSKSSANKFLSKYNSALQQLKKHKSYENYLHEYLTLSAD
ncbi:substrate-binding periplasmic protein [Catenovulum agarivorans]|uniref:substrate-binding periplasmic protein n=1 Tax=Catenovulum agarivorans TaxID=1172192 RepID=UPI0002EDB3C4|nr:transporter substrate-binding domain-containing protein [Catenovulum agarivorans]